MADRKIRKLLERLEPDMAKAFREALDDVTSTAQRTAIEQAIRRGLETGNLDLALREVITALNLGRAFFAPLDAAMTAAFVAGAIYQTEAIPRKLVGSKMPYVAIRFDGRHPRAEAWTRNAAGNLIEYITDDVRENVRQVLTDGFENNRTYRRLALDLIGEGKINGNKRVGGLIGLHPRQTAAVLRARLELESGDYNAFRRRAKAMRNGTFDRTIKKAIKDGSKLPTGFINKVVRDYADRLLNYRGNTIARTESNKALVHGRKESVDQMIDDGKVHVDAVTKRWSATLGQFTRDSHAALNGAEVGWREYFRSPITNYILRHPHDENAPPSETVNCRCLLEVRVDWVLNERLLRRAA